VAVVSLLPLLLAFATVVARVDGYEVWFNPLVNSTDMLSLFTQPNLWPSALGKVEVFKFFEVAFLPGPCSLCGPNTLDNLKAVGAVSKLTSWGKTIAVETEVLKNWDCKGILPAQQSIQMVYNNVAALGGRLSFLDMDEPMMGAMHYCGMPLAEGAQITASFITWAKAALPGIVVGDIEPYPYYRAPQLEDWITTLINLHTPPAWFHIDLDFDLLAILESRGLVNGAQDMKRLDKFCNDRGIPFGVIINGFPAANDNIYGPLAVKHFRWFQEVLNMLHSSSIHIIFESWDVSPPVPNNLPETAAYTHTWLIDQLVP